MGINIQKLEVKGSGYMEYIATDECAKCGGQCCKIGYDPYYSNRSCEQERIRSFAPANTQVAEYKTKLANAKTDAERKDIKKEIEKLKINLQICRYLSDTGCVIPRESRTATCRGYICYKLRDLQKKEHERLERNRKQREYRKRKKEQPVMV